MDLEQEAAEPDLEEQAERWRQNQRELWRYEALQTARIIKSAKWMTTIDLFDPPIHDQYGTMTVGRWGGYLVQIMAMGFNNRVVITPEAFALVYDYGWCYDKGPAALLAVLAWDPQTEGEPLGFKKRIGLKHRVPGERSE